MLLWVRPPVLPGLTPAVYMRDWARLCKTVFGLLNGDEMRFGLILAILVAVLAAGTGLVFYGYSLKPQPKPVHVEIPNDQFPH